MGNSNSGRKRGKRIVLGEPIQTRVPIPTETALRKKAEAAGLPLGTWLRLRLIELAKAA